MKLTAACQSVSLSGSLVSAVPKGCVLGSQVHCPLRSPLRLGEACPHVAQQFAVPLGCQVTLHMTINLLSARLVALRCLLFLLILAKLPTLPLKQPWGLFLQVNNCVGFLNLRYFLLFLATNFLICMYGTPPTPCKAQRLSAAQSPVDS